MAEFEIDYRDISINKILEKYIFDQPVIASTGEEYPQIICEFLQIICGYPKIIGINPINNLSIILGYPQIICRNIQIIYGDFAPVAESTGWCIINY